MRRLSPRRRQPRRTCPALVYFTAFDSMLRRICSRSRGSLCTVRLLESHAPAQAVGRRVIRELGPAIASSKPLIGKSMTSGARSPASSWLMSSSLSSMPDIAPDRLFEPVYEPRGAVSPNCFSASMPCSKLRSAAAGANRGWRPRETVTCPGWPALRPTWRPPALCPRACTSVMSSIETRILPFRRRFFSNPPGTIEKYPPP